MSEFMDVLRRPDFIENFILHIEYLVLATLLGILIAIPVAIAVNRSDWGSTIAINIGNIGRAIPSLAVLVLMFPLLGLGFDSALFALTLLAIPPILINAVVGLRQVNPQILDSAKGMGLSGRQVLAGIQVPIAAPIIFAGIRTSAVMVVASATLATFIAGGLSVAVLAIITEVGFGFLERTFTPKGLRIAQKRGRATK